MSEYHLHVAIINHLMGQKLVGNKIIKGTKPFPELFITHIFQGRSEEDGFFLKRMGVYPGVSDILCLWRGGIGFIEVKTEKGYLSPAQKKFKGICNWLGVKWALVRSVQQAHDTVAGWGVRAVHNAVIEHDQRSKEEKEREIIAANWGPVQKFLTVDDMLAGKVNPEWRE